MPECLAVDCNAFLWNPWKLMEFLTILHLKTWLSVPKNSSYIKTFFLTLKPVSIARVAATLVKQAGSDLTLLWLTEKQPCLCWTQVACLITKALHEHCHKSSAIDFALRAFNCLLVQPSWVIATWQGLSQRLSKTWSVSKTWAQTWSLQPAQQVVVVYQTLSPH